MSLLYGIDLDGVCFDFLHAFSKWLEDKTGIEMPQDEEITSYYWHETVEGLEEDTFWREFHKFGQAGGYKYLELLPDAKEGLEAIKRAGHRIIYITNRPDYALCDTQLALQYHLFPFSDNLIFANGSKSPIIKMHRVDVFIDDSPSTIEEISMQTSARIYCKDYPFNRKLKPGRFTRVHSWEEFLAHEQITTRV
ncbi:hypothetical protein E4G67_00320 [Candidatus Bathyarchaeota archaeon]|nr:MAG: hypothetical protein E4G67_00320 [Candidatus Bathyarchaeota archaeon]